MTKRRTLIWALAAVSISAAAQVQRADFSTLQKALIAGPQNAWLKEAQPIMTAAADMIPVEKLSPSLQSDDTPFNIAAIERVGIDAVHFDNADITATVVKTPADSKSVSPKAAGTVKLGDLITTDNNYQGSVYHYRVTLAEGAAAGQYTMTGIYGQSTPVNATIDAAAGTVTIPYQVIGSTGSDDVYIVPMSFEGGQITYSKSDIKGTINAQGEITLPGWGLLITEGANAGRGFNFFTNSVWKPANVTVTAQNTLDENKPVSYGMLVEQTSDNSVTLIGLSGITCETINARLTSTRQIVVPNSLVYNNQMYGEFYLYPANPTTGKAQPGANLIGKGNEAGSEVVFGQWLIASRQLPSMYVGYAYNNATLSFQTPIKWPATPEFKGEGNGTEASPYLIKTVADFQTLAAAVAEGNDYAGTFFKLAADLDLSSVSEGVYIPVGDTAVPFNGTFDGAGFTFKNLTVTSTSIDNFGLFGAIGAKGVVKNINAVNIRIGSAGSQAGVIAGWCEGTIDNANVTSSIVIVNGDMAAGIAGGLKGGKVLNSSFQGALQGNGSVAGIAGQSASAVISGCQVRANIIHSLYFASTSHDAAGIVGAASKTEIINCTSTGSINDQDGYACSGGLVGRLITESHLQNSMTTMTIQAVGNPSIGSTTGTSINCYQGGLAGYCQAAKMTNCYSASYILQASANAKDLAGGLMGYMGCSYSYSSSGGSAIQDVPVITNCFYAGQVYSASTNSHKSMYGSTFISASWTGPQPYELAFVNSFYDNQVAMVSGDEWGRPTSFFTASLPAGFDASVWKAQAGKYPVIAALADTQVAELASAALVLADGQNSTKVSKNFTVTPVTDVTWGIADGSNVVTSTNALAISGSNVTIKDEYAQSVVVAQSKDGWGMKYYRLGIVPHWFQGEGTEDSPYQLSSAADFVKLNTAVSTYNQSHAGDYFTVTNDIDFAGSSFQGIGTASGAEFGAVLDGANHTIKNLKIEGIVMNGEALDKDASMQFVGLIGMLSETGAVKNIVFDASNSFRGVAYVGSAVGASFGSIENVKNYAPVASYTAYVGGITSRSANVLSPLGQPLDVAKVVNCYNAGTVTCGTTTGGGIVGQNYALVQGCQNDGDVYGKSLGSEYSTFNFNTLGGIVGTHQTMAGYATAMVDQCVNNGSVSSNWGVGGIIGYISQGSVSHCVNNGIVTSWANDVRRGAIIGQYSSSVTVADNYYDSSININGGSNNAGLSGITGLASAQITSGEALAGLDAKAFDFSAKKYPVLAAYKDEKASEALRSMVIFFPEGMVRNNLTKPVDLSTGTTWKLTADSVFKINGQVLSVTMPEGNVVPTDTIIGTNGAFSKVFALAAVPAILKGEGTAASPFLIETPEDWNKLSDFMLETKYEYPATHFQVVNDLDFKGDSIKCLAVNGVKFNGIFDGNGKTVSNYVYNNFNSTTSATSWKAPNLYRGSEIGLFGTLGSEGTIKNLTANGDFHIYSNAGGIVGNVYGTVDNCHNKGTVSTIVTLANGTAGGSTKAAGIAYKLWDGGQILNCSNSGTIISKSTYCAGIVMHTQDNTLVENCVNTGLINPTTTSACGIAYEVGGMMRNCVNKGTFKCTGTAVGVAYSVLKTGKLEGCGNEADIDLGETAGTVSGVVLNTTAWAATDGVEPAATSWLKNCYNTGNLSGKTAITGIASSLKSGVLMEGCYNTGNISALVSYNAFGLVQTITGNAKALTEDQPYTVMNNCWNSGKITAKPGATAAIGGLAKTCSKGFLMDNCYNLGDVILDGRTTASGQICVAAGLINQISGGLITNCWNAGKIYAMGPSVGGLAGYIAGDDCTELRNCFNLGDVTGSNEYDNKGTLTEGNTNGTAGGLFGYISTGNPKVINCYNAGTVTGNLRVGGIAGGMFRKTTILQNVYNSGKVVCENEAKQWWSGTCYLGGNAEDHPSYFEDSSNVYFDATVNPGKEYSTVPGSAKTTAELCALNLGEGFLTGYGYPYLTSFYGSEIANPAYGVAGISTAVVLPTEGNAMDDIKAMVTLGSTDAVTWTSETVGEDGGSFDILDGQARPSKVGAAKLIATSLDGKFVREFNLVITQPVTGLDGIQAVKEIKSMLFVDMQGRIIPAPVEGQPYVVRINYVDGTSETRRMIK